MKNQRIYGWLLVSLVTLLLVMPGAGCQKDEPTASLPTTSDVTGQVYELGGYRWIAGARVELGDRFTTTSGRGEFTFASMPFGQYQLRIQKDGFNDYTKGVTVERITPRINVWLTKQPIEYRDVAGLVVCYIGSNDYAVENARVSLANKNDLTDADGKFLVREVPYGQQEIRVEKDGFRPTSQPIDVNANMSANLTVPLTAQDTLEVIEERYDVEGPIWLLNRSDVVSYVGELNQDVIRDRVKDVEVIAGGTKTVVMISDIVQSGQLFRYNILTLGGALGVIELVARVVGQFLGWINPPQEMYSWESLSPDGKTYTQVGIPIRPILNETMAQTMDNDELLRATHPERGYYREVARAETPDRIQPAIETATREAATTSCAIYLITMVLDPTQRSKVKVFLCGMVKIEEIAAYFRERTRPGQKWIFYARQPNFQGNVEWPMFYGFVMNQPPTCTLTAHSVLESRMKVHVTITYNDPEDSPMENAQLSFGDGTTWPLFQQLFVGGIYYTEYTYQSIGTKHIVFSADDTGSNWQWHCESSQDFTIAPNTPPTSSIECPPEGRVNQPIHIANNARDDRMVTEYRFRCPQLDWDTRKTTNTADVYVDEPGGYDFFVQAKDDDNEWGAEDHCTVNITRPNGQPTARFTVDPPSGDTNTNFTLDAGNSTDDHTPTASLLKRWDYDGDGTWDTGWQTSNTQIHQYECSPPASACYYYPRLIVKDEGNLTHEVTGGPITVGSVNNPPTACFTVDPPSGNTNTNYIFDAVCSRDDHTPTASLLKRWDYDGDGTWDTGWQSNNLGSHYYSQAGTYYPKLIVKDEGGLTHEVTGGPITVGQPNQLPTSNPSCPGTSHVNLSVKVTNNATDSDGYVTEYRYRTQFENFTRTYNTAQVTFPYPGSWLVYMSAKDNVGDWGPEEMCVIEVSDTPNQLPVSHPSCPTRVTVGEPFTVTNNATDSDGTVVLYHFRTAYQEALLRQNSIELTFYTSGHEQVCMAAQDDDDDWSDDVCCEIEVVQPNQPPISNPSCPGSGQINEAIAVTNNATDIDGTVVRYRFRTDEEDFEKTTNIGYVRFTTPGSWLVYMSAKDDDGEWGPEVSCGIEVEAPNQPPISQASCPGTGAVNQPITVTNNATDSDGTVILYRFRTVEQDFNQTGPTAQVTFTSPGSKIVWLYAKDDDGAWSSASTCEIDIAGEGPNHAPTISLIYCPAFSQTEVSTCIIFDYSDPDGDPLAEVQADWRDGSDDMQCDGYSCCHTYHLPGNYLVSLLAKDLRGLWSNPIECFIQVSGTGGQNQTPTSNPDCPSSGQVNEPITVHNYATDPDGSVTEYRYRTQFENFTRTSNTAQVTFPYPGSWLVYMSAKDDDGEWGPEESCGIEVGDEQQNHPPLAILNCPDEGSILYGTCAEFGYEDQDGDPMAYGAIDWRDDSGIEYIWGPGSYCHNYTTTGWYEIRYTVYNNHDGWGPTSTCWIFVNY